MRRGHWEHAVELRLLGIDTPELRPRSGTAEEKAAEKVKGIASRNYLTEVLSGKHWWMLSEVRYGSYRRLSIPGGPRGGAQLLKRGKPLDTGSRQVEKTEPPTTREFPVTKAEVIASIAENAQITKKQATAAFDEFQTCIQDSIKDEDWFALPGFGTFKKAKRGARTGTAPDGSPWKSPAHNTVTFKPAQALKDAMGKR